MIFSDLSLIPTPLLIVFILLTILLMMPVFKQIIKEHNYNNACIDSLEKQKQAIYKKTIASLKNNHYFMEINKPIKKMHLKITQISKYGDESNVK